MNDNDFVAYLNSNINVSGDTTGSLAEKQVKSKYFGMVKVERRLGKYIYDCIVAGEPHAFILTGHAGDGKTSILAQVLQALERLPEGEGLEQVGEFPDFYYVKDMSELSGKESLEVLKQALNAPSQGRTSLLISNTGPLLRVFTDWQKENYQEKNKDWNEEDQIEFKSRLLTQLDQNSDEEIRLPGLEEYPFYLVNIARIDNVSFSTKIFRKIVNDDLWTSCNACLYIERCPIKNNRDIVSKRFERVSSFVENVYRYLYENDKRMTIRQMVAQLSYGLTGNLSCDDIRKKLFKAPFFNYNFANLFFGYRGLKEQPDAVLQIQGIKQLKLLKLDQIALDVDYSLFVKQDYTSCFPEEIQEELKDVSSQYRGLYCIDIENASGKKEQEKREREKKERNLRQAVRRYYLMYGLYDRQQKLDQLMDQLFGSSYTNYQELILKEPSDGNRRKLQNLVFEALYMKNTGMPSDGGKLYLTLRRGDNAFQNVMLILGEIEKSDLKIRQIRCENRFEDNEKKNILCLTVKEKTFPLSLPMVNYFGQLKEGVISSNENPALTHNIASLDALLLDEFEYGKPEDGEPLELKLLVNTARGQQLKRFTIENGHLNIIS